MRNPVMALYQMLGKIIVGCYMTLMRMLIEAWLFLIKMFKILGIGFLRTVKWILRVPDKKTKERGSRDEKKKGRENQE